MRSRSCLLSGVAIALAAALTTGLAACRTRTKPPNVLLISIDSLRADRLGCYGQARETSPTLDQLAAGGVRFARAYSPTSWTLPSHVTLLSGLSQEKHQVVLIQDRIRDGILALPAVLSEQGFQTTGFYSGPFLHPSYGFAQGFEEYISCQGKKTETLQGSAAVEQSHHDRTNGILADAFEVWARERAREPFFAFVHLWDVHYDYIPPEPYASMFDPDYTGELDGSAIATHGFPLDASPRDVEHLLALYDGEIRYADATIARIFAALRDRHLLDDTLVVVTADHGDEFLDHGGKGHQHTLYDELVHVPLILWAPRRLPASRVIETPVALEDVVPTILEILDVSTDRELDGQSLAPLIEDPDLPPRPVVSVLYYPIALRILRASIRDGQRKVLYTESEKSWGEFDLAADPGELRPSPDVDGELRQRLASYLWIARRALVVGHGGAVRGTTRKLPKEIEDQLRALGYLK